MSWHSRNSALGRYLASSYQLRPAIAVGAFGFGVASLFVFASVAFAERWFYQTFGLYGAYVAWTLLFFLPPALALQRLVEHPARRRTFVPLFAVAFVLYAVGWTAGYMLLRHRIGEQPSEVVASAAGSLLLALVLSAGLGVMRRFARNFLILLAANTLGYFVGGALYFALGRPWGMVLWGVAYGLALGSALGTVMRLSQPANAPDAAPTESR